MYALSDYDYHLPKKCIAQQPASRRDRSRLLYLDRRRGQIRDQRFDDLAELLQPGDLLVVNDTAVIPARILGRKETGGKIEVLLLDYADKAFSPHTDTVTFKCLIKASRRPTIGSRLIFEKNVNATIDGFEDGIYDTTFCFKGKNISFDQILDQIGTVPLPPYIVRNGRRNSCDDPSAYQTVYAKQKGAVAAPTAGLHFTPHLLRRLKARGVDILSITLHVGYGTFSPVRADDIRDHRIHTETYRISEKTAHSINTAQSENRRIICVGTTSCRTLEYASDVNGRVIPGSGVCDLFIYPGYRFKVMDALITNFHLPQSTLLMLVSAVAGRDLILSVYQKAIQKGYRFYSYGDAMFIG